MLDIATRNKSIADTRLEESVIGAGSSAERAMSSAMLPPSARNMPRTREGLSDVSAALARGVGARISVLHAHVGSGILDVSHWPQVYAQLVALAERIGTVAAIDVGGGLGVPYQPEDKAFDVGAFADARAVHEARFLGSHFPQGTGFDADAATPHRKKRACIIA